MGVFAGLLDHVRAAAWEWLGRDAHPWSARDGGCGGGGGEDGDWRAGLGPRGGHGWMPFLIVGGARHIALHVYIRVVLPLTFINKGN